MNEPPKRSPITTGGYIPWLVRAKYNAMGKRAMTEDIRKKHIVQKDYIERKQGNEPYLCQSIHSVISVADVDALFAALDEAKDGLTAAHMHGFEEGRDQYMDKVRKLQDALDEARAALRDLYLYPGVRDLLAPHDSLGSYRARVEKITEEG